jgi:iron-sulfur cluster assembly accessory protein
MTDQVTTRSVGSFFITPKAESFVRTMVRFGGKGPEAGFRLQVTPGGCSGMSAEFSVEDAPKPNERSLEIGGVRVFIPLLSYGMLEGITIDYVDTATKSGFVFIDPKASSCACSSSTDNKPVTLTPLS